jgi:aldehyde:ferredoxin oxidoreductase
MGLTPDELREMIRGYYRARGWDESGFIPETKLRELDLTFSDRSKFNVQGKSSPPQ